MAIHPCIEFLSSAGMKQKPERIISLVPSQTELLYDLGLNEEVIGITKFCVHPGEWFKTKTRIGGTKNINIEKIKSLKPDLIIANKEENVKEQVEALQNFTNVYVSDILNLNDALNMILQVGELAHRNEAADKIATLISKKFSALKSVKQERRAAYLIWQKPYMAAGGDTFIHDMMQYCGLENVFADKLRYPETTIEELQSLNCEVLLLSSEPFPFKQKQADEIQSLFPSVKIMLVDGEMFSWYGSRLIYAADYFDNLIQSRLLI
ncbi:ABC transporter substrate-binding protein [Parafilimonas terrae]|uniref:ABC-type Fe3+-hydroxamate transport system, substrate-binding protein n=1 Tax=Parafilimonas terrae TaxID=1465490 RepID=A0A1I5W7G8_9BACT|nr:helical backbone metal receptor [Parafilimonas terrae]SFQ15688.1 ABC-type Fe3+-hydroxamate transport system, substrate-binding protein [Parafilimonas terrae]